MTLGYIDNSLLRERVKSTHQNRGLGVFCYAPERDVYRANEE